MASAQLTDEQRTALTELLQDGVVGLHSLDGQPGSGKSWCARWLANYWICQGRRIASCATTGTHLPHGPGAIVRFNLRACSIAQLLFCPAGAAATRLSSATVTVHHLFHLPTWGRYLAHMSPLAADAKHATLKAADVIIIDEFSMLTKETLYLIFLRLMAVHGVRTAEALLQKVLLGCILCCLRHFIQLFVTLPLHSLQPAVPFRS